MNPGQCVVVMYHYVQQSPDPASQGIKALSARDFEAQLDWLEQSCQILDYPNFEEALRRREADRPPAALLTFDDGFRDHYEQVWPILRRRGLSGVFFISGSTLNRDARLLNVHKTHLLMTEMGADGFSRAVTEALIRLGRGTGGHCPDEREGVYRYDQKDNLDLKKLLNYELPYDIADQLLEEIFENSLGSREDWASRFYLDEAMIREMSAGGMHFGYHTRTHRVLSRLDRRAQQAELADGVELVRLLTVQDSVPFCYPYGHRHTYDENTLEILTRQGYAAGFNTVRRVAEFAREEPFEIPRLDTRDLPPLTSPAKHP